MLETLSSCPLCNSSDLVDKIKCKDYLVTNETFTIQACKSCGFLITNPRPDKKSIVSYYKSDNYVSHANQSNSLINIIYRIVRRYTLFKKIKIINRFSLKGRLLDYGCGTGHFIQQAKSTGWEITGIEPDDQAKNIAASINGSDNIYTSIEKLPKSNSPQYNIITMFHVLEHIHDLNDVIAQLMVLLKPKGILLIAVPNHQSFDAKKYNANWAAYDLPRHLYHFDSNTIARLAQKYGLKIVAQLPMKFDSYYVSTLSEKQIGNPMSLIKGFLSGLVSNMKAKKTKEYSSNIFILEKQ